MVRYWGEFEPVGFMRNKVSRMRDALLEANRQTKNDGWVSRSNYTGDYAINWQVADKLVEIDHLEKSPDGFAYRITDVGKASLKCSKWLFKAVVENKPYMDTLDEIENKIQLLVDEYSIASVYSALSTIRSKTLLRRKKEGEIDVLELSKRVRNCLLRANIETINDCIILVKNSTVISGGVSTPMHIRGWGVGSHDQLVTALIKRGHEI